MLFEIGSTILMGGLASLSYFKSSGSSSNDADKIQRVLLMLHGMSKERLYGYREEENLKVVLSMFIHCR